MNEKRPIKILVVDDDSDIRGVIKKGLKREEFEVDESGDPIEVLKGYKPGSYDLLILDIKMPNMNGFQLYREIRKLDKKVRVCFITAFEIYYDEFRRVFPKLHVTCFIQKPVTISQLAKSVREVLASPLIEDQPVPTQTVPKEHAGA